MRSMKGEVVLNIPAEKAWEMYRDNEVISKINPDMLAAAEYIQGDGSPGSLRLFKLGPVGRWAYINVALIATQTKACGGRREMRSMKGEVVLNIPAEKAWEMYRDNEVISKINPDMLAAAEYIQGDGSPGSLRLFKLGPAVRGYVNESTEKIEKVEKGRSVSYSVIRGCLKNMYDPYRVTFSFTPMKGQEEDKCIAEWKAEFEVLTPETPVPEKARDAALGFLKSFENYELSCQVKL